MKPPWQIAWPFSMSRADRHRELGVAGRDAHDAHAEALRRAVALVHRDRDALGQRLRVGGRQRRVMLTHERCVRCSARRVMSGDTR